MAFKQPRVPEYRESEGVSRYMRPLILFLKDFTMGAWTANNARKREIEDVRSALGGIEIPEVAYPVTSVNRMTGDVTLGAGDVGALAADGTAADSAKLGGADASEYAKKSDIPQGDDPLSAYPVGSVYINVNSTSPAQLFGGSWTLLANRFLIGAGGSYAAGSTGGTTYYTLRAAIGAVDSQPSLLGYVAAGTTSYQSAAAPSYTLAASGYSKGAEYWNHATPVTDARASDGSANTTIMPPWLAVYMWKRVS